MRPSIVGPESPCPPYPIYLKGPVIKGFGRGSKELGIPTANLSDEHVQDFTDNGIYYGYAQVEGEQVEEMVMSIGFNPFYNNTIRSAEVHIIHDYPDDFYAKTMRVIVLGYIRPEYDYTSIDDLIADIKMDIKVASESLKRVDYSAYKTADFWAT